MEVSENLFGPQIHATFAWIAVRQFDNGDSLRPEEEQERDHPEPDSDAAVGGDRRNDVEIEDRNHEEQNQIAAPEGADQVRLFGLNIGRQSSS